MASSGTGKTLATSVWVPKARTAAASPMSSFPGFTAEMPASHADRITVRGAWWSASRSYTVNGPSASCNDEKRGLSAWNRPSARTTRYVHSVIRKALADAVRKGLVIRNVAVLADPPSAKAARAPEMQFWTPPELSTFLRAVSEDELFALYRLASMTGLRRGEVCGLRWADVDLDGARVQVRHQLNMVSGRVVASERPKSDHGRRTVDLDAGTVAVLRRHRAVQLERRLAIGSGWRDSDLVFCGPAGAPLNPDAVSKAFHRRARACGVPAIRFHDLRHTHCAHLIAAGRNPREISQRLGHASVSFTLDRYGHLMPEAGAEAAAAVAKLVDGTNV
jgi:integrase